MVSGFEYRAFPSFSFLKTLYSTGNIFLNHSMEFSSDGMYLGMVFEKKQFLYLSTGGRSEAQH